MVCGIRHPEVTRQFGVDSLKNEFEKGGVVYETSGFRKP